MAELENLLLARERVLMAQRRAPTLPPFAATAEETAALEKLRATLDAQEASLQEARAALKEREAFVEQSETVLMEKVAAQQEHEIMLEQRYEDLRRNEHELRKRLAEHDPVIAAELEAERTRKRDEFND
jgi:septal ring factor EnvC (AmiA/AmiB activator)